MIEALLGLAVLAAVGWLILIVGREVDRRGAPARLAAELRRLDAAREGGTPERAIVVVSPAQIEPRVEREPCPRCGGSMHVETHEVDTEGGALLRRVLARCGQCGEHTTTWFSVAPARLD
ncbi:MAG TPA: hypothetical protein VFG69_06190 [Nannocystaceae bacterium]|nr:hypothetical protein [Nannocystaceae bacterium]